MGVTQAVHAGAVSLAVTPNPAAYGAAVTLTATVSAGSSNGIVAFYDGVMPLGVGRLSGTTATLTTRQLLSGARKLTARYAGAVSPVVVETVTPRPASSFNPIATYPVGPPGAPGQLAAEQSPAAVAIGDFNQDGKLDAVLPVYSAATGSDSEIAIMLGNGNGTFQSALHITAGTSLIAVAVGDFNNDGKPDVVLADAGSPNTNPVVPPSINILLGNGNGTFLPPAIFPLTVAGFTPYYVLIGDFNLDGSLDVAVSNSTASNSPGNLDVSILTGNGNGTLNAAVSLATGTMQGAYGLALGDFNGDGIPDLAVSEDVAVVLLGRGDGTFTNFSSNMVGTFPIDIQTGDFNNDGKADLAVASFTGNEVSVLLGKGDGTFLPEVINPVGNSPQWITVADMNGDGKQDLAVADSSLNSGSTPPPGAISVLTGNGDGTFQPAVSYPTGPAPVSLAQGDFTGMGTVDLATADFGDGSPVYPGDLGILLSAGCVSVTSSGAPNYDSNANSFIVTVNTTGPSCSWTATTTAPWLFLSASSGTGYSQFVVTIVGNASGADRTGTILIGGQTLTVSQAFTQTTFADVTPNAYYFDAVNLLAGKHITSGCATNAYCPGQIITRDQMAVFIVRSIYGSDNFPISPVQHFTDVSPSTFGYQWIQKMYELGITTGCGNGTTYCPTSQVTRDQMAVFIIRARYGSGTAFTYNPTPVFADVPTGDFAFKWVQRMAQDGITTGCAVNSYCPSSPVTRGDMAVFIMRGGFNQILPNSNAPVITSVTPTTLSPGASATFTVTGSNVSFVQGLTVVVPVIGGNPPVYGITASPVTLISPTQFTVTLTASPSAPSQPYSVYVQTGTAEAVLPNAILVQ